MKRRFAIAVLSLALLSPALAHAQAWPDTGGPYGGRGGQDAARDGVRSGRQVPLSRVLANIASRTPGRHLNTSMGDAGGRPVYNVQWQLPDGRVVIFVVDAESGAVMSRQGG